MRAIEKRARLAVIGGSGTETLFTEGEPTLLGTPYGVSPDIYFQNVDGRRFAFMARHGTSHAVPPHLINFRANIIALRDIGVERILAINAVGSLKAQIRPGDFVLVHDFMDFTKSRPSTFFEGTQVVHVDMTEPYCPQLRRIVSEAAKNRGIHLIQQGVYVCTEGPRFESPAEIRFFQQAGADVVGMTGVPEVVLAREAGICYCSISVATNFAAGMQKMLSSSEVSSRMDEAREKLVGLIQEALKNTPEQRECQCGLGVREATAG